MNVAEVDGGTVRESRRCNGIRTTAIAPAHTNISMIGQKAMMARMTIPLITSRSFWSSLKGSTPIGFWYVVMRYIPGIIVHHQ
jgi:hypothetical protein